MAKKPAKVIKSVNVDPRIWAMAEAAAKKYKQTTSKYIEDAVLWDLQSDGNPEAWRMCLENMLAKMRRRFLEPRLTAENAEAML